MTEVIKFYRSGTRNITFLGALKVRAPKADREWQEGEGRGASCNIRVRKVGHIIKVTLKPGWLSTDL